MYYLVPEHTTPGKKSVTICIQPETQVQGYRLVSEDIENGAFVEGAAFEITKNGSYQIEIKDADGTVERCSFQITFLSKKPAFDGGNGTPEDPYQISTLDQLNAIRLKLGAHYVLTADIDLTQWGLVWIPIGKYVVKRGPEGLVNNRTFTGSIDGKGHKLSGLCCGPVWTTIEERNEFEYEKKEIAIGFFGCSIGATFRNLYLEECHVSVFVGVGCLAGEAQDSTIENCHASGIVDGTDVAGLVYGLEMRLKRCSFCGKVTAHSPFSSHAAGLCSEAIAVYNCEVYADICGSTSYGICNSVDSTIKYCVIRGRLSGNDTLGGICFTRGSHTKIYDCICALEQVQILPAGPWDEDDCEKKHFSAIDPSGELFYAEPEEREYWDTTYKHNFHRENIKFEGPKNAPDLDTSDGAPITDEQLCDCAFLESVGWNFDGCWYMGADGPHLREGVCKEGCGRPTRID